MRNNSAGRDRHVLRYFSAFVTVSAGRVVRITKPSLKFCPLACHFFKDLKNSKKLDSRSIKQLIKKAINSQIKKYGFYTPKRTLKFDDIAVPYGASEMLMYALKKGTIDSAVVVCDGAGTLVTTNGTLVQGIGAHMNSLFRTSPIRKTMSRLKQLGGHVVSEDAVIDQVKGIKRAIQMGYKKIAVTVNGYASSESLKHIRKLEKENKIKITILVICTTGVDRKKVSEIKRYADMVWSCASQEIREHIGSIALLQISKPIPVFILTKKGLNIVSAYEQNTSHIMRLKANEQYLISNEPKGHPIILGTSNAFLLKKKLPVQSHKCPVAR